MEYNDELVRKLVDEITEVSEIELQQIPCIDLYMDQITTFFDEKLGYLKRDEEDKILTKTMINNYTKGKILMPANKKKYTKEHLILLILIYNLKQSLSISDIREIFKYLFNDKKTLKEDFVSLDKVYDTFLEIKKIQQEDFKNEFENKKEIIKNKVENIKDNRNYMEIFLTILTLINEANMKKKMAEKLIDSFLKEEL